MHAKPKHKNVQLGPQKPVDNRKIYPQAVRAKTRATGRGPAETGRFPQSPKKFQTLVVELNRLRRTPRHTRFLLENRGLAILQRPGGYGRPVLAAYGAALRGFPGGSAAI